MIKSFLTNCALFVWLLSMLTLSQLSAQQTVFTEDFNAPGTPQNSVFTTSGSIGTSKWTVSRSGNDFGAKIDQGFLTLTNDVGSTGNVKGWVLASTSTSNFLPAYNPILSQNAGIVSWTFNIRQLRTNPAGLTDGLYGVGYVLAGTEGSTNKVGKGYAIMLGQSGYRDAIRFVTYNNGIQTYYTKLSSSTSGLSDFGSEYTSIRVEYNPANNEWSLYVRKDNSTSFNDPKSATLVYQGKIANKEFVNEPLTTTGAYWNAGTGTKQTSFFDNISVSVVTPEIISINPDSKIANSGAFTLTVDGKGFTSASKVYWNGSLRSTTYVSPTQLTANIPGTDLPAPGIVPITVRNGSYISNAVDFEIESSGVPVLTLSKNNLPLISTVQGTASVATDTYTISGSNLTAPAILTAPANFEISVNNDTYEDTKTLANSGGVLVNQPLSVKARLKATAPAGNYTGNITHTTTGALTTKVVALTGRVLATEPTSNATLPTFTNITSTGFRLGWTNSVNGGDQRIVLIRPLTAVNGLPVDATTYNANAAFATGTLIGTDNYVVYKGSGNFVQITGLEPNKLYHISIVEFNGLPGTENYRTIGLTGSATTLNSPAGLQVKVVDTSYKIDFDNTVDGVNLDIFQGSGISKIAESGQLDSDSWAFTGFAKGNIAFGGESLEDSSYENGTSEGDEFDTGLYAFNVGTANDENYTLGIQPGGTDFNPGTMTLRIQNQTGAAATSLNIGYKVYIYNDQASSSKIGFSYLPAASADGSGTYTSINSVDVISPTTADLAPGWKAYYRVATIVPATAIANNAYFYIRWSGSLDLGTGAQDEFAIDDIEVIANPGTNTVSFDGIADDFVLQGNASLSADLSVQNRLLFNGGKLAIKDKTLTIAGTVVNTTFQGITGGATSNLIIRGTTNPFLSFDQTTPGATNELQSFSLIGTSINKVSVLNNVTVNQLLKTDGLQILDLGNNTLSGSLTGIQNNGTILTQNTGATPFPAGKTWGGTGILNLNATSDAQTLVAGTYNNLTLSSSGINGGTTAVANVMVNGILALPNTNPTESKGSLSMSTFTLIMGPDGTNTGVGDVTGIVKRDSFVTNKLYTFGHPNSSITFPPAGTLPSTMSAKLTIGAEPSWRAGTIKRQFDIIQTGAVDTKAIIRQHYLDSELNSNVESKLAFWAHTISPLNTFDQGRSNNNMADNYVEISNADIGLYFKSTFDKVYITLDETSGSDLVWNGSTSTSWITSANWSPAGVPSASTKVFIPNVSTTSNRSPIIDVNSSVKSITIDNGAIVNTPTNSVLNVFDGAGAWQNNGLFNPANGTVIFNNLDATISGSTTFNNLTIGSGSGLRALEGNYMSISGTLTNNGTMFTTLIPNTIEFIGTSQIIPNVNGLDFGGYHNLIVSGTGTTLAPSITTLNIRGDLTLNNPLSFAGKTINLAGISNQTIGGSDNAITFNDLIVNKETGAVLLAQNITIDNTLTLASGNIVIGSKNLTLGTKKVEGSFDVNHMIVADGSGLVRRPFNSLGEYFFPIGEKTSNPAYSPINVKITSGSMVNAFVGVSVVDAIHPNNYSSQNYISRYWNVLQTGITGAVADITANYVTAEVLVPETTLAAGQLDGTFNIITNPWKKVGTLANKTLSAIGVNLTNGQNSVITGIKGGNFSVEVFGYGSFCIGSTNSLNAVTTGGDAPFTYIWSNTLPNSADVVIPTNTVGTTNYTLTVRDANGFVASDNDSNTVTILPASVGGTITNNTPQICAGSLPGNLQLSGNIGSILYWQKSTVADFATFENIANFTTTLLASEIGPLSQTTYFRAVLQNGTCAQAFSDVATIIIKSTTWNGSGWDGGIPDPLTSVIFAGNYNISAGEITACNCQVNQGVVLTVGAGSTLTVQNDIFNNGSIIVESDANLIQISNDGKYTFNTVGMPLPFFTVKRNANIKRLDYVYWSSPVNDQKLKSFSPGTLNNRFLTYNEWDDKFTAVPDVNANFIPAKGYAIRASNTQTSTAVDWPGNFIGTPNNGLQKFTLEKTANGYNMVGNPYPSNISFDNLVDDSLNPGNSGLIHKLAYFWTNTNPNGAMQGSGYPSGGLINNYAIYNGIGGLPATSPATNATPENPSPTLNPPTPNGMIKVGQAFIVQAIKPGDLIFRNNIKVDSPGAFFDKSISVDRFWLNLTTPINVQTSTLIGYKALATNNFELDYDAPLMILGADAFFSILDDRRLAIQGRASFVNTDVISLGSSHYEAGNYTISLGNREGVFANGQNIYLKDKQNGIVTDLSEGNYIFTAGKGLNEGRFEILYQPEIVLGTGANANDEMLIYRDGNEFVIRNSRQAITNLQLFDVSGRLILQRSGSQKEWRVDAEQLTEGVFILKVTLKSGEIQTRKIRK